MRRRLFSVTVVLFLAGAALTVAGVLNATQSQRAVVEAGDLVQVGFQDQAAGPVYEGRIRDVRPAWGYLILTVGKGEGARDIRLNITEARIVGRFGNEWKGQDLSAGDRVRVQLTRDRRLVQQISVLEN